jgi:hypothetical protein
MLDEEIYGLIIALGILLALFYFGVLCISINVDNIRLRRRYKNDPNLEVFIRNETLKGLGLILLELALVAALLLVKAKFF